MTKWAVVAGGLLDQSIGVFDAYAGIDGGCLALLKQGLPLDLAVGDFDSVTADEKSCIQKVAKTFITAPAEKDDTDLELVLKTLFEREPDAQVILFGALGGRVDHSLSTLFLPSHPELTAFMRQLTICDRQNRITFYPAGQHQIDPLPGYTYVGFSLEGQGKLVIKGARYEMDEATYFRRKSYGSNEFLDGPITLIVPNGYALVTYSKDV